MNTNKFTLGADPEFFLLNKETKEIVSAHNIVPGTKEEPVQIDNNGTKVLADGLAVEFNIKPANSGEEFVYNIETALASIEKNLPPNVMICKTHAAKNISAKYLNSLPETTSQLGCSPDISAYTWEEKIPEENYEEEPLRTVAGHLHIGYKSDKEISEWKPWNIYLNENPLEAYKTLTDVVAFDTFMGIPLDFLDHNAGIKKRRTMYGQFGSFRLKPYGIEYRSLSNFWLWNKEVLNKIWSNVEFCLYRSESYKKKLDSNYKAGYGLAPIKPNTMLGTDFSLLGDRQILVSHDLLNPAMYKTALKKYKYENHPFFEAL